jgi:hypothetical protein
VSFVRERLWPEGRNSGPLKLAWIATVPVVSALLAIAVVVLFACRSRSRWVPMGDPESATRISAPVGQVSSAFDGRVTITVRAVTPGDSSPPSSVKAEVTVADQPSMVIEGAVGSRFRDKGGTIEIQVASLSQGFATFLVWSVRSK